MRRGHFKDDTKVIINSDDDPYGVLINYLGKRYHDQDDLIHKTSRVSSNQQIVETVRDGTFLLESLSDNSGTVYVKVYPVEVGMVSYQGDVA